MGTCINIMFVFYIYNNICLFFPISIGSFCVCRHLKLHCKIYYICKIYNLAILSTISDDEKMLVFSAPSVLLFVAA